MSDEPTFVPDETAEQNVPEGEDFPDDPIWHPDLDEPEESPDGTE